jgi:ferritin-like metal-binding protein YciE
MGFSFFRLPSDNDLAPNLFPRAAPVLRRDRRAITVERSLLDQTAGAPAALISKNRTAARPGRKTASWSGNGAWGIAPGCGACCPGAVVPRGLASTSARAGACRIAKVLEPPCLSIVAPGSPLQEHKMPKQTKTLQDLFHETLKDIYYAEKKILTSLPKMAKAAQSPDLRAAFEKHERETEGQVERLEQVFALIEEPAKGKTCDAINGILKEGKEIMTQFKGSPALDAGLLAAAQAVEHYEMSRYGTLMTWADELGLKDAVGLLAQTLQEEKKTDAALTALAESAVNQEAQQAAE